METLISYKKEFHSQKNKKFLNSCGKCNFYFVELQVNILERTKKFTLNQENKIFHIKKLNALFYEVH